jgi:hypothetical protein
MGRKFFISYKYADNSVYRIDNQLTTVRTYVDLLIAKIKNGDEEHKYEGERNNEDLSKLSEDYIWQLLRNKLYDTTLTIVLISPQMKEYNKADIEQWIPWEIRYSLQNSSRDGRTSSTNALLGVVLPDTNNQYTYFVNSYTCSCGKMTYTLFSVNVIFNIMAKHICNRKSPVIHPCSQYSNQQIHTNNPSYMPIVCWEEFYKNPQPHIDNALVIRDRLSEYIISKQID